MRSFSDLFLLTIPPLLGVVLLIFFTVPMYAGGLPIAPNVGLLMTLTLAAAHPAAWPRWFAFLFGLLQDVMFGTPLGSQALLLVLLVGVVQRMAQRGVNPPFQARWLEAAGMIFAWHIVLWLIGHFVTAGFAPILILLRTALATALWYPLFYAVTRVFAVNR